MCSHMARDRLLKSDRCEQPIATAQLSSDRRVSSVLQCGFPSQF